MPHNDAIDLLFQKKLELEGIRDVHFHKLSMEISGIETAIEMLSGKKVWEVAAELKYDDEHPDYIKSSIEE